jgi:predicted RND superfamily exporter protein
MNAALLSLYNRIVLGHPVACLLSVLLLVLGIGWFARDFRLDASADSLVLENDADLRYYREVRQRYVSDDFLVITYTPRGELFSPAVLDDLRQLHASLEQLSGVAKVLSILKVPLLNAPQMTLSQLQEQVRTLETPGVDPQQARDEFLSSPLYRNLILSSDGKTTALQVTLKQDEQARALFERRNQLRIKRDREGLSVAESEALARVSQAYREASALQDEKERRLIATVRTIMDAHRGQADLHLGGIPMIVADMIDYIRSDLFSFGIGVLVFLVLMLGIIFRRLRWILLPMGCCALVVLMMFGFLGLFEWRVTVVSSNFVSLLLIITLSMTIHLVVRYHELHRSDSDADQRTLVLEMVRSKMLPSIYTTLTTIVAFVSLLVSGIRPIIDFGWMMAVGLVLAFVISFLVLPAGLMLLQPNSFFPRHNLTGALTRWFDRLIERHGTLTLALFAGIAVMSLVGISQLTVENRFIDYFKQSTEIYQGMVLIDRQLGGTTPLEVIVDAPDDWQPPQQDAADAAFDDPFAGEEEDVGLSGTSYWYTGYRVETIEAIHDLLNRLPETGKVLSMATTFRLIRQINGGSLPDDLMLSVIYKKLPAEIEQAMFDPYLNADGNQLRFAIRIQEADRTLQRNRLLQTIRSGLQELGLETGQVHLSGMFVLYNNVLTSLYRSQILTLGAVFLAIMLMFLVLFRSWLLALIAIIPNLVAAASVLGLMGWANIPLDIMTITIAAITIGIAVDDTIHYVHRFIEEMESHCDHQAAVRRCHQSVGRAMYYTSITVIIGFSILVLSNFKPTIYFGLLTGLAMAVAMVANLTLLALLLLRIKPPIGRCLLRKKT